MFQSCRHTVHPKFLSTVAFAALLPLAAVGCDSAELRPSASSSSSAPALPSFAPSTTPSTSKKNQPADYSGLLLQPADLSDHQDNFALRSSSANQKGLPGASALFVNADDTRAISDTIVIYPDAATAAATLRQAVHTADTVVTGGTPQPSPIGTGGTVIQGTSPDGSKAVTLLLFTHGNALARLEFGSATGDTTTGKFVTDVGKMQQIALRIGMPATE